MIWTIIGVIAAALTMFGFIPQIIKVIKTRSAKDVSLISVLQIMLGVSFWIIYGIHLKDPIIILANAVTFSTLIVLLVLYLNCGKYKNAAKLQE